MTRWPSSRRRTLADASFALARASVSYTTVRYQDEDCLLFGAESYGLPADVHERYADRMLCVPMPGGKVRSLNLATTAGIVLYEALRQVHGW